MQKFSALLLTTLIGYAPSNLYAATIKQLLNSQDLAIVELSRNEKIEVGENFLVNGDNSQCLLEVLKVNKRLTTVSTKQCTDKSILSTGQKVEKSLFETEPPPPPPTKVEIITPREPLQSNHSQETPAEKKVETTYQSNSYKALILGTTINPTMLMNINAIQGTTSEVGKYEYEGSSSFLLGYEYSQFNEDSWNNGINIDYVRVPLTTARFVGNTLGTASFSISDSITSISIAYAGKYRWSKVYLPIGLGFTSSTVDSNALFTRTLTTSSLAWLGIGLHVSEKFNIELLSRATAISGSTVVSSGITIKPAEYGYLRYFLLNFKILF